jgi:oligopeptide transport system permease protein
MASATNNGNQQVARLSDPDIKHSQGYWRDAWSRLAKNKAALVGLIIILINIFIAVFAPLVSPEGIDDQKTDEANAAPEWVVNLFPILDPRDESFPASGGTMLATTGQEVKEGDLLVDFSFGNVVASASGTTFLDDRRIYLISDSAPLARYPLPSGNSLSNMQEVAAGETLFGDTVAPYDGVVHIIGNEIVLQPNLKWRKDLGEVMVENLQTVNAGDVLLQGETGNIVAPFAGTIFVTRNNVELALVAPLRFTVPEGATVHVRDGREVTIGAPLFDVTPSPITGDVFIVENEILIRQFEEWLLPEFGLNAVNGQHVEAGELLVDNSSFNVYANMDGTVFIDGTNVALSPLAVQRIALPENTELSVVDHQPVVQGTPLFGGEVAAFNGVVYITDTEVIVRPNSTGYTPLRNEYLLGADYLGRDLWSRLAFGARVSLLVALVGPLVSFVVGLPYGLISGYFGGSIDNWMMRFVDLMYAFPTLLLIILLMAFFRSSAASTQPGTFVYAMGELDRGSGGMFFIFLGTGLTSWMGLARLTRGQVLQAREQEYVVAARALGQSVPQIMLAHILPNILGPIVISETLSIPTYISYEAFLSFIGLGVNAPTPSWGIMISDGARVLQNYPHETLFPALALFLIMFAFNFLGDGLRDALDPRLRGVE